jgi:hypothetical protein
MLRRTLLGVALATLAAGSVLAQNCDTRFQVVNQTDQAVREIYIDSSALPEYTVDRLGSNVLQPGQVFNVSGADPGLYDIKVVMMNDATDELRQVNVCQISRVLVTPNGLHAE